MLLRWDPFRELDRLTEESFRPQQRNMGRAMPIDAWRRGETFHVAFDLPGIDPASIDLTVEKNVLQVRAERSWQPAEGDELLVAERPRGAFTRQLFLGETLDTDRISATYEHGVLHLTIPVAEAAKPRKVEVQVGEGQTAIETTGSSQAA